MEENAKPSPPDLVLIPLDASDALEHPGMNNITCVGGSEFDFCMQIVSNPDISGIGVRVVIYFQTFLNILVTSLLPYHEKAFRNTSRNAFLVSTGLMIACLIERKTLGLSLYDALIITMLTTLMTAFVTANRSYMRTLGLSMNISSFLYTTFWVYWGLQVWSDPKTFGNPNVFPEGMTSCNASTSTVFVVFGQDVPVTNSGIRGVALFIFSIGSIFALSALWQCIIWSLRYLVGSAKTAKENAAARFAMQLRNSRTNPGVRKQHMTGIVALTGVIYMVVTTEQIVKRNLDVPSQVSDWTYSQTIAMIMLGQQFMDCFSYFKEELSYRKQLKFMNESLHEDVAP